MKIKNYKNWKKRVPIETTLRVPIETTLEEVKRKISVFDHEQWSQSELDFFKKLKKKNLADNRWLSWPEPGKITNFVLEDDNLHIEVYREYSGGSIGYKVEDIYEITKLTDEWYIIENRKINEDSDKYFYIGDGWEEVEGFLKEKALLHI